MTTDPKHLDRRVAEAMGVGPHDAISTCWPPRFQTDPALVVPMLEWAAAQGAYLSLNRCPAGYTVEVAADQYDFSGDGGGFYSLLAHGTTANLALCTAVLAVAERPNNERNVSNGNGS